MQLYKNIVPLPSAAKNQTIVCLIVLQAKLYMPKYSKIQNNSIFLDDTK